MNFIKDIGVLYESFVINEIAGAINYWLHPDGELVKVADHMSYVIDNLNYGYSWNTKRLDVDGVYESAYNDGYIRVVEDHANVYFTYKASKHPSKQQFKTLYDLAMDKGKNLVDGETGKVIVTNNEAESDTVSSNRNEKLDSMDRDIQPSFYKVRKKWAESYEQKFLKDYTKLIYEYNIKEPEPDYRQRMVDDAIEDIQKAKAKNMSNNPFYSLESKLTFWKGFLSENGFSDKQVQRIISYALYDRKDQNPLGES
jgi:hypothetical protein